MKEKYVKPALYVESFTLSQSIAMLCGKEGEISRYRWNMHGLPLSESDSTCAWDAGGGWLLFHEGSTCNWNMDEFTWEGICYNSPNDSTPLFSSG